jgi:hypothetical protein
MPITIPPYQDQSPSTGAELFLRGTSVGTGIAQTQLERQRLQQSQKEIDQQFQLQKQRALVQDQVLKQRQEIMTRQAAAASKAMMDYQNALQGGMDPTEAAMQFGPAMSGGKMTGFSPVFSAYERDHAPTFTPNPVYDKSGKLLGHADRNGVVHYIPQAKAPPPIYETTTTTTPGTDSVPGIPAVPPVSHLGGLWTTPGIPAIPGISGKPKTTVSRRIPIPMGPPYDQDITNSPDITYPAPPSINSTNAMPPGELSPSEVDDPLGILNK